MLKNLGKNRGARANINATADGTGVVFTNACAFMEERSHEHEGGAHNCKVEFEKGP